MKFTPLLLCFGILLISCRQDPVTSTARPVARVFNKYLYATDLIGIVPPDASPEDSVMIIHNYINNWVRNQLLLQHAEKNLSSEQKNFEQQLQDYRNSLIIYAYENELVRQHLDTVVHDYEIENYYSKNPENFILSEEIIRLFYIKIREEIPAARSIERLFKKDFSIAQDSLVYFAINFGEDYAINTNEWIPLKTFLARVPLKLDDPQVFLRHNRFVEIKEPPYIHFIYFLDYRLKGSAAPLEYEKPKIKLIILNQRKNELIRNMHREIYQRALKNNQIEFY